jgi:hypothetical protein
MSDSRKMKVIMATGLLNVRIYAILKHPVERLLENVPQI